LERFLRFDYAAKWIRGAGTLRRRKAETTPPKKDAKFCDSAESDAVAATAHWGVNLATDTRNAASLRFTALAVTSQNLPILKTAKLSAKCFDALSVAARASMREAWAAPYAENPMGRVGNAVTSLRTPDE
jgi:hypothetical protein